MQMRRRFEAAGGTVLEKTAAQGVRIHPDGVALQLQSDQQDVTGRLLIDCMGNFSPIVQQVLTLSHMLSTGCGTTSFCVMGVVQPSMMCA